MIPSVSRILSKTARSESSVIKHILCSYVGNREIAEQELELEAGKSPWAAP